jgi:hypothetical protein
MMAMAKAGYLVQLRQLPHSECKKTGSFAVFEAGNTDFFVE